ncbi:MAG: response regulator [Dyadobacter sp.]|uniref:response regulator n=1 Tax=Dyadobacter sp. TaxID=1914288 RepID=UPI00326646AB
MINNPIVIADDDADDRAMMVAALNKVFSDDQRIIQFPGGSELLTLVLELITMPRIILLDMVMPRFSGIEILTKLRANKSLENVPIVLLSGDKYNLDLAIQARADGFYSKPTNIDGFMEVAADIKRLFLSTHQC